MGHFPTLDLWRGPFGDSYHKRNVYKPDDVRPVFDKILNGIKVDSVLEVGCGQGHNLLAIDAKFRYGIEPNKAARDEANDQDGIVYVFNSSADRISRHFSENTFDLVLTCGLLIHIPPTDIETVVREIARVSSKYVLCIEYAAAEEEMVEYRGEKDILWRRPFGKLFQAWADMELVDHDDADSNLYPGCSWWLLRK